MTYNNGYRGEGSDIAYLIEFDCAELIGGCEYVAADFEVVGTSEYVEGDKERYSHDEFYADKIVCPNCQQSTIGFTVAV